MNVGLRIGAWDDLPAGYNRVEYIQKGLNGVGEIEVEGKAYDSGTAATVAFTDEYSFADVASRRVWGYGGISCNHYASLISSHPQYGNASTDTSCTLVAGVRYRTKYTYSSARLTGEWRLNGSVISTGSTTQYTGTEASPFGIFNGGTWKTAPLADGSRYYGSEIFFDGVMVGKIVPCLRLSDSKYGVFNLVDKTFWS